MFGEFKKWAVASVLASTAVAGLLGCSHWAMPQDPTGLIRYVVIRLTAVLIGMITLSGGMLFIDFITPDDWMDGIGKDPTSSAIVMSAVILTIGAILCWT
jgi:drug/metabolite transporter (DMT)-like permease